MNWLKILWDAFGGVLFIGIMMVYIIMIHILFEL